MKQRIPFFLLFLCLYACSEKKSEDIGSNVDPDNERFLAVKTSSDRVALGGAVNLEAYLFRNKYADIQSATNYTFESVFFVDGEQLPSMTFLPENIGTYKIKAILDLDYADLYYESEEIEIVVIEPLNKKILLEYYTSRGCGFCPWVGFRVDSLNKSNDKIIGYAIHGGDELEIEETSMLQEYQQVDSRPSLRINRGYLRSNQRNVKKITDSIDYQLGKLPPLEISIQSQLNQDEIEIKVFGKFYEEIQDDIYLTVVLVEDDIITFNQANNYGASWNNGLGPGENPIPEYVNHNVLRMMLTELKGDFIIKEQYSPELIQELGFFQTTMDNISDISKSSIIALVHFRRDDIEVSSALNSQIVKVGENIDFHE